MNWYLKVMRKYAVFSGRACRKEYWIFSLINLLIGVVIGLVADFIGGDIGTEIYIYVFLNIYYLAVSIPSLAVSVRRLHDTGHSGWWSIVPIVGFVFLIMDSQHGENKYGPEPKVDMA